MSFIKNEDDTQSSVSIDLSVEDCGAEEESLLEASNYGHQQQLTTENMFGGNENQAFTDNSYGNEHQATTDQQFQPPLDEVFYTKPSLNLLDGKFFQVSLKNYEFRI